MGNIKFISLKLTSKSFVTLHRFMHLALRNLPNTGIGIKNSEQKNRIRKITLLKSPHVDKTAQEHFEIREFLVNITLCCTKSIEFIIALKLIARELFPNIKLKTKFLTNDRELKEITHKLVRPENSKFEVLALRARTPNDSRVEHCRLINANLILFELYGEVERRYPNNKFYKKEFKNEILNTKPTINKTIIIK